MAVILYLVKDTVTDNKLARLSLREKGRYALAFCVIAAMLYFVGFPVFLLFFFGVLVYFIWKAFSSAQGSSVKRIFELYLTSAEILREDGRRWFGFEVQQAIEKGETLVRELSAVPPLVHFVLGALHRKSGDQAAAVRHLSVVAGDERTDESAIFDPTKELADYARVLRKVEREPSNSPVTSSAVRSLERLRRTKADTMLADSLAALDGGSTVEAPQLEPPADIAEFVKKRRERGDPDFPDRRTISEVLHDIYDEKAEG